MNQTVSGAPTPHLSIDGERLWSSLMQLARIGATPKGGSCRLALTPLDAQGRDLVVQWMRDAGLSVHVDRIGNIFGRRPGLDSTLPPIMTGSHIDTQPTGGKFDGCFGVLAGLEVMRTLQDHGVRTRSPLELAIWTNEEGSRFAPAMMGSGVFAGQVSLEKALDTVDQNGESVRDALQATGYAGTQPVGARPIGAYLEAHIEQGPILEREDKVIGAVTGSLGLRWYDVTVTGMEMHAGPTPMEIRRDALYAATFCIQAAIEVAHAHAPNGRGTVGVAQIYPGSRNVIPGTVSFTVDLRHADAAVLAEMDRQWRATCAAVAQKHHVDVNVEQIHYFPPTSFDAGLIQAVRDAAAGRGHPARDIVSGAGHDAVYMAGVAPAAMIFVPCKDGISHNELEDARPEHLATGCNVLLDALLAQAGIVGEGE